MSISDVLLLAAMVIDALGLALHFWESVIKKDRNRPTPGSAHETPESEKGR